MKPVRPMKREDVDRYFDVLDFEVDRAVRMNHVLDYLADGIVWMIVTPPVLGYQYPSAYAAVMYATSLNAAIARELTRGEG